MADKWKVGVTVRQGPNNEKVTLWTLDNLTNEIRLFDSEEEAKEFAQVVWAGSWVVEKI
jgi:hypothetical protein